MGYGWAPFSTVVEAALVGLEGDGCGDSAVNGESEDVVAAVVASNVERAVRGRDATRLDLGEQQSVLLRSGPATSSPPGAATTESPGFSHSSGSGNSCSWPGNSAGMSELRNEQPAPTTQQHRRSQGRLPIEQHRRFDRTAPPTKTRLHRRRTRCSRRLGTSALHSRCSWCCESGSQRTMGRPCLLGVPFQTELAEPGGRPIEQRAVVSHDSECAQREWLDECAR
jgi:hypothetical protein